jgi:hypothetical protein
VLDNKLPKRGGTLESAKGVGLHERFREALEPATDRGDFPTVVGDHSVVVVRPVDPQMAGSRTGLRGEG